MPILVNESKEYATSSSVRHSILTLLALPAPPPLPFAHPPAADRVSTTQPHEKQYSTAVARSTSTHAPEGQPAKEERNPPGGFI